ICTHCSPAGTIAVDSIPRTCKFLSWLQLKCEMCRFEFILLVLSVVWVAEAWGAHYPTSLNSIGGKTAQQENRNWLKSETQDTLKEDESECSSCGNDDELGVTRWTMPLLKTGEKRYYLGIFFKANWFKAQQYCRFHGMHLASVSSQEENDKLEKYVKDSGYGREHFWTSGTDLAEEGNFFWMANGRPLTFVNWNAGEPNNFRYENGEEENCLELWNRDDKGLKWNDSPCSFETFFICEVRSD
ncbi:hypothetical protein JYU34_020815, partial [Plutella xylostella]